MDVIVNQMGLGEKEKNVKKRRKSRLSVRKKTKEVSEGDEIAEIEVDEFETEKGEETEKPENAEKRIFSSDVCVENILDSTRRKLSKFSSEV